MQKGQWKEKQYEQLATSFIYIEDFSGLDITN